MKGKLSWRTVILLGERIPISLHMKADTNVRTQSSNGLAKGLIISLLRPKNSELFDQLSSQKIEAGDVTWQ
jgi:hypothetical protein